MYYSVTICHEMLTYSTTTPLFQFPESLFAMLSNPELSSIITWLPHGRSFIIVDKESLAENVLPMYFRHSHMSSFTRQLNGYGFMKIRIGPFERR